MNSQPQHTFDVPILLITFNRPNHTRKVWDEIKKQKPRYIYVFQDGARNENALDQDKCKEVRAIFEEKLDWDCELHTYYSDKNLGCGKGPVTAITWFFDQVEAGIVLEDDCVLSETAWHYYELLLDRYKDDERIGLIVAANLRKKWKNYKQSYHFARVGGTSYGCFASWRRVWKNYDYSMNSWVDNKLVIRQNLRKQSYYDKFAPWFDDFYNGKHTDAWDYQWFYCLVYNNYMVVVPSVNMLSNIGFDAEATHTTASGDTTANMVTYKLSFPLIHPCRIRIDSLFDEVMFQRRWVSQKQLFTRIKLKLIDFFFSR